MTIILIVVLILALFGAPIFACLAALAAVGASLAQPGVPHAQAFAAALERVFHMATSTDGDTLATIPLFTFMGYVLAESKTADRLVEFAKAVVGWIPGGLAVVTILVCAMFTTVTGASGVTIVAVGGLVMPALIKEGYKERFALGLVTGTGSIGLLFPPALPLIIYGIVYGLAAQANTHAVGDTMVLSDFDLQRFLYAGIVPGLVLVGAVALYSMYVAIRDKVPRTPFVFAKAVPAFFKAAPELAIPGIMIVALQLGFQIPEAAALTVMYVLVLEGLVYRDIKLRHLPRIAREAMCLVGAIFILIVAATALTDYFVNAHVPENLTEWITAHIHSKYTFLIALNVMLLAVGSVMDIFSALLVVVPLIAPVAAQYHIDGYHLGVIFLLNLEIGYVHPPVGLNLFISSFRFRKPMVELYYAIIPFVVIMLATLLLVTYVPALSPVRSKPTADEKESGEKGTKPGLAADAGPVMIRLDDGGVWSSLKHCEDPAIKDDPLAYPDCKGMFVQYQRCETLAEEIDRIDCRDAVVHGKDPFAIDAAVVGGDAGPAEKPPDAGH